MTVSEPCEDLKALLSRLEGIIASSSSAGLNSSMYFYWRCAGNLLNYIWLFYILPWLGLLRNVPPACWILLLSSCLLIKPSRTLTKLLLRIGCYMEEVFVECGLFWPNIFLYILTFAVSNLFTWMFYLKIALLSGFTIFLIVELGLLFSISILTSCLSKSLVGVALIVLVLSRSFNGSIWPPAFSDSF